MNVHGKTIEKEENQVLIELSSLTLKTKMVGNDGKK